MQPFFWAEYIPIGIAVLCFLIIISLGFFNQGGGKQDAENLFYALFLLAVFFLLITTSYNPIVLRFKNKYGAPVVALLTFGIFIAYLILLFKPWQLKFITPLPNFVSLISCAKTEFNNTTVKNKQLKSLIFIS